MVLLQVLGGYNNLSDYRLKRDITPLSNPLNNLLEVRGVRYNWRKKEALGFQLPEGADIGVIAQEVQKVFPEAVTEDEQGILSVAHGKLTAPIIEAIRELSHRLDIHQKKLQEKDREIIELKKKNKNLEKLLLEKR